MGLLAISLWDGQTAYAEQDSISIEEKASLMLLADDLEELLPLARRIGLAGLKLGNVKVRLVIRDSE